MPGIIDNIIHNQKNIDSVASQLPKVIGESGEARRLICQIRTYLGKNEQGENQYDGYLIDLYSRGVSACLMTPLTALNGYEYSTNDIAEIGFTPGGFMFLYGGGTFSTGEDGYGFYFAE